MDLPFTAEVFDSLVGRYNAAIWPAQLLACVLALAAVTLAFRPVRGGSRTIAALLAAAWAWVGVAFHLRHAATIDFAAPVYGAGFLLQALLLAWSGVVRGTVAFRVRLDLAAWTGLAFVALAVILYPLLAIPEGRSWTSAQLVGIAPDPTVMATLGFLLMSERRPPLHLLILPALWSVVAGTTAWMLGTPDRLVLPAAAVVAVGLAVRAQETSSRG